MRTFQEWLVENDPDLYSEVKWEELPWYKKAAAYAGIGAATALGGFGANQALDYGKSLFKKAPTTATAPVVPGGAGSVNAPVPVAAKPVEQPVQVRQPTSNYTPPVPQQLTPRQKAEAKRAAQRR